MSEYDFLHPLNDLLPSGEVCQDWPSAMHDHVSTLLNISAHSYSKSAVKAFHLIFTNHLEATKVTVFSSLSSISIRTPIEHCCMCCEEVTIFYFLCHLCDLFTVVLKALFVSCAPVCGSWCGRLLERGWFSTDWCSVKWSCCLSVAQDELMCTHEPLLWTCVCHHGFKHTVLPIISFGQGHIGINNTQLPACPLQLSCNVLQWEWVSGESWLKVQVCGENTECIAHLYRTVRHYMHLDEYIHEFALGFE